VLPHPGEVDSSLLRKRSGGLEYAFEFPVAPPRAFLRYLLTHPDELHWPMQRGERKKYKSPLTMRYRTALLDGPQAERTTAIRVGLDRLERFGTRGSRAEPA
jgi:hypothetical protein